MRREVHLSRPLAHPGAKTNGLPTVEVTGRSAPNDLPSRALATSSLRDLHEAEAPILESSPGIGGFVEAATAVVVRAHYHFQRV